MSALSPFFSLSIIKIVNSSLYVVFFFQNLTYCCDYITLLSGSIAEEKAEIIKLKSELERAKASQILKEDQSTTSENKPGILLL